MCDEIDSSYVMPGWGCCKCRQYNGPQHSKCKSCGHVPCKNIDRKALAKKTEEMMGRQIFDPKCFEEL